MVSSFSTKVYALADTFKKALAKYPTPSQQKGELFKNYLLGMQIQIRQIDTAIVDLMVEVY